MKIGDTFEIAHYNIEGRAYKDQYGSIHSAVVETNIRSITIVSGKIEEYAIGGGYKEKRGQWNAEDAEGNEYTMTFDTLGEEFGSCRTWTDMAGGSYNKRFSPGSRKGQYPIVHFEDFKKFRNSQESVS